MLFIAVAHVVSMLQCMSTLSFHKFIMGKMKVGLYLYLTLGTRVFLQKLYRNVP